MRGGAAGRDMNAGTNVPLQCPWLERARPIYPPRCCSAPPVSCPTHCSAALSRSPFTSCSGVTYRSLMVGRGLPNSMNTAWQM